MDATLPCLMDWIPQCSPAWKEPWHLGDLVGILDDAPRKGVRALVGCPIRHYKTSTVHAAISLWLRRDPTLRVIYMTYSIGRAVEMGKEIRDLCKRTGTKVNKEYDTIALWRTEQGGGVDVMSAQQSRLGADVDVLVVDDPFESGPEADRIEVRTAVDETITHYTMRLSRGGSCVIVMSPWHPDDAIGRRVLRQAEKWTYVHKPAISLVRTEAGGYEEVALAPSVRTLDELRQIRAALAESDPTERLWWAQWQCQPQTPHAELFHKPARYSILPTWPGYRDAIGFDGAYSSKTGADWFALVRARFFGGQMFVREARRFRADEGVLEAELRAAWEADGQCPIFSYMSGPEVGTARNLVAKGLPVQVIPARFSKLIRARKAIDRCNASRLLLPDGQPWVPAFERRLLQWRALDGDEDDEIDALVSVHDGVYGSGIGVVASTCGRPRAA